MIDASLRAVQDEVVEKLYCLSITTARANRYATIHLMVLVVVVVVGWGGMGEGYAYVAVREEVVNYQQRRPASQVSVPAN